MTIDDDRDSADYLIDNIHGNDDDDDDDDDDDYGDCGDYDDSDTS